MSISSEITRISGNVSDALTAIGAKGVTVPSGSNSDDLANLIAQISGGGATYETYYDGSITTASDKAISIPSLSSLYFSAGETWRVTWDGTEYTCSPNIHEGWLWYIGNHGLTDGTDDGVSEPFCLYNYGGGALNGMARTSGTHTLKLEKQTSSGGGGSATLITKNITANGTYSASDDSADGYSEVTVNVPSSGGSSNIVTGTFTGTTTGTVLDVNVNYSGIGYPIAIFVVPTGGMFGNTTYNSLVQRYAIGYFSAYKTYVSQTPTYQSNGTENQYSICSGYKSSTSAANNYTRLFSPNIVITYGTYADPSGASQSLLFRTNKKFSVRIASTSYGFAANIEYTYYIIYSS